MRIHAPKFVLSANVQCHLVVSYLQVYTGSGDVPEALLLEM